MRMPAASKLGLLLLLLVTGRTAEALEPFALYDNFSAARLSPIRWRGLASSNDNLTAEAVRQISLGQLQVLSRDYGPAGSADGAVSSDFGVQFANASTVTAVKATVTIHGVQSVGCPASDARSVAATFVGGDFFNTDASTPGSAANDVLAGILIVRLSDSPDPADVLRIGAVVGHCLDATCEDGTVLALNFLGFLRKDQAVTLTIQWDPDLDQFVFRRAATSPIVAFSPYGPLSDSAAPGRPVKGLFNMNLVATCAGVPRPTAFIHARFDNVYVNQSAAR